MRNIFFAILILFSFGLEAQEYSVKNVPNVHLLDASQYVTNPDTIISLSSESTINYYIAEIEELTSVKIAVVVLNSVVDDEDIDLFGTDLFEYWSIGSKYNDNGLLFLLIKDQREMIFRTGYGLEGVLPDIYLSRIIRNVIVPEIKNGNFDAGVVNGIEAVCKILKNPEYADELKSRERSQISLPLFLIICFFTLGGLWLLSALYPERKLFTVLKWISYFFLFPFALILIPILGYIKNKYLRNKVVKCTCGLPMRMLKESEEDVYLKQAQISEEKVKSVDYDVWLCSCGKFKVKKYDKMFSKYQKCKHCNAKTSHVIESKVLKKATRSHSGKGVSTYKCKNCNMIYDVKYTIPIITDSDSSSSGSSSSSSGGSWGGGSTGGGGARGGW